MNKGINGGIEGRYYLVHIIQIFGFPDFFSSLLSSSFCHLTVNEQLQLREGENRTYSGKHANQFSLLTCFCKEFWWNGVGLQVGAGRKFFVPENAIPFSQMCCYRWSVSWAWLSVLSRNWLAASVLTWQDFLSPLHISRTWPPPWPCSGWLVFSPLLDSDPSCSFVLTLCLAPKSDG